MTALALSSLFVGVFLGCRFGVLSLIPVIGVTTVAIFGYGLAQQADMWAAGERLVVVLLLLQVGYLVACLMSGMARTGSSLFAYQDRKLEQRHWTV